MIRQYKDEDLSFVQENDFFKVCLFSIIEVLKKKIDLP